MCSNLLTRLFHFSLPFLDRQRDWWAKSKRGTEAKERRKERTEVPKMKPCEVRCGKPSQYEAGTEREQWQKEWCGLWHSRKGEVRVTEGFMGKRKRAGKRTPKASKAIKRLNYFSRRAIKKGIRHSHTESRNLIPGKGFQPTHPFGHDTPQCYLCYRSPFHLKKKNTWYHLSNELWLTLKMKMWNPFTP